MREISAADVTAAVRNICIEANTTLAPDMVRALDLAREGEKSSLGKKILGQLEEQHVPVCAPAVTLETLQEARCALEENGYETQVVQVAVTDVIKRGEHHMMDAQNPVFLIAGYPAQRIPEEDMPAAEDRSAAGQTALWNAEKE